MGIRFPKIGQRINQSWRTEGPQNLQSWILGEQVTGFDDLKDGSYYLSDNAIQDRLFLMKVRSSDSLDTKFFGTYVILDDKEPIDTQEHPIHPENFEGGAWKAAWEVFYAPASILPEVQIPKPGQRLSYSWRPEGQQDFRSWVMGEEIKHFDDLTEGHFYLKVQGNRLVIARMEEGSKQTQAISQYHSIGFRWITPGKEAEKSTRVITLWRDDFERYRNMPQYEVFFEQK